MRNQIYYRLKPFIPRSFRMFVRRIAATRKRRHVNDVWPVLPGSERPPAGWSGWPEGKQFAFVLTHDVEGPQGVANTRSLYALEKQSGFRSSYNFVPEGSYRVSTELREELVREGFEVGVHDLAHDGWLYKSRAQFRRNADRINQYLRDWNATGFRSGFMLHNLEWLHDLNVRYDASTFDTDPFEPQPDGSRTIFPFWVPQSSNHPQGADATPGKNGYVELSYTLVQDSTLFLLLGEQTSAVWIEKLDWVASQGGMALVNIHPDYIDFSLEGKASGTYSPDRVRELLDHVANKYGDKCWNPCATELAEWYVGANPPPASAEAKEEPVLTEAARQKFQGKRAAVLSFSPYPSDLRVLRSTEAMLEVGMEVDVICQQETPDEPTREPVGGADVLRLPLRKESSGKLAYLMVYGKFLLRSFALLAWRGWRRRYDIVHVHNMPDVLVFAALVPKLLGARVILDLHDPMPELMTSIYGLSGGHWFVRTLRWLERLSIGFSDLAVTPNVTFSNLFVSRSCRPEKMVVVMNSPQSEVFDPARTDLPSPPAREGGAAADGAAEFRLMHHGSIVHRHGLDLLVEAVARVVPKLPGVRLNIYGPPTPFLEVVLEKSRRLGISDRVQYHGIKTQEEVVQAIHACDLGIIPNRRSVFTDINLPMRLFEYLAMRKPVVAPSARGICDYFKADELLLFERENVDDLANKILWAAANPRPLADLTERGFQVYRKHLWEEEKARFLRHVARLVQPDELMPTVSQDTRPVETRVEVGRA